MTSLFRAAFGGALLMLGWLGVMPWLTTPAGAQIDCSCRFDAAGNCIRNPACRPPPSLNPTLPPPPPPPQINGLRERNGLRNGAAINGNPAGGGAPPPGGLLGGPAIGGAVGGALGARVGRRPASMILDTGYSPLAEPGQEVDGYGLYSYAILPTRSTRGEAFLREVFRQIRGVEEIRAQKSQINIFYIPTRPEQQAAFASLRASAADNTDALAAGHAQNFYDHPMANSLLYHLCNPPNERLRALCRHDLSRGPYIFTYASPASRIEPVPPPYLLVDLSDVHERAFGELLVAFKEQVKRDDISDEERINTLRLRVLQVSLTAADWIGPVQKALADIVHQVGGGN